MGRAKEAMMEQEHNTHLATAYLIDKGLLSKCEIHEEVYNDDYFDLEDDFWRAAMADRKRGNNGPIPWAASMEPREFTDLLKETYENSFGDGCGSCAKNAAD